MNPTVLVLLTRFPALMDPRMVSGTVRASCLSEFSDGAIDSFDVGPSGVANGIFVDSNVTGIDMSSERSIPGRVLDGSKDSSVVFTYGTSLACKKALVSTSPAVIQMVHGFSCH